MTRHGAQGTADMADVAARIVSQLTDHAVIALDPHGEVLSWNEGARRLTGYDASEVVGRSLAMFYTVSDRATGLPFALLEDARSGDSVRHSGLRVRKDGSTFWAEVVITAVHDDDGTLAGYAKVTRDLTVEHALEMSLRESEERFRSLVEQVVDYAIIGLDVDGTITSWNAGAERLKLYHPAEAVGRHFSMFYLAEDRAAGLPERLLAQARADGHVEHTGWRVRRGGATFWGNVVITALRDDGGAVTGFAKVTRDLTAHKRFEEARESFFHAFAHDFRNPVAAIAGFAELLAESPPAEAADLVARITTNARRLVEMTSDLVEHTRLASEATPRPVDLPVRDTLEEVVRSLPDESGARRVEVDGDDAVAHADRAAFERVAVNLVTNALKYSPDGSPVWVVAEAHGDRVRVVVSDRGRGIDPLDLPHIFEEFQRGRLSEADGGVGLGLASVRRLVGLMHGTVDIESTVGVGTTVTVEVPAAGA